MEKNTQENLRRNAFLNSITGVIDYSSKLTVNFFLNPFIISVLGSMFFGVWQIISQLNGYMATADIRAATSLKFILSRDRSVKNDFELKKVVSLALYSNILFVPLYIVLGAIIVWIAPSIANIDSEHFTVVRIATSILVLSFLLTQVFFIFESTLHGMNLAYKRIGVRAFITIVGGGLTAIVLYKGYGIIGMAFVQVILTVLIGITFYWIIVKNLPWFEFVKVKRNEIVKFIKLSGWYMLLKLSDLLNQSIDLILLGFLAGPNFVSIYVISKYTSTASTGIIRTISGGASIGVAKFIGEHNYKKLMIARKQLILIQLAIALIIGLLIIIFNKSFVILWTANTFYSGDLNTYLIVLVSVLVILQKTDSNIINSTLDVKSKIKVTVLSAVLIISFSFYLIPLFDITGLLISLLIGAVFLTIMNSVLVSKLTSNKNYHDIILSRPLIVGIILMSAASYISSYIFIENWFTLISATVIASIIIIPLVLLLCFEKEKRSEIIESIKKIKK